MRRIFVYCHRNSDGARALSKWLSANAPAGTTVKRVRELPAALANQDLVVAWGNRTGELPARVLNGKAPLGNKLAELKKLEEKGVNVPPTSETRKAGWLARRVHHRSANDLLANLARGDYYVEPVPTVKELRVHVFKGKVIRVGLKVPRNANAHPMFRTDTAGWALTYNTVTLAEQAPTRALHFPLAIKAVKSLGYDFGAVDLGIRANGRGVVFEVNSAPGLEGTTIDAYGRAVLSALSNQE